MWFSIEQHASELVLCIATLTAASWWYISLWLCWIRAAHINLSTQRFKGGIGALSTGHRITIFKPIPDRHGASPSVNTVRAISSFVDQLGPRDELLLAMSDADQYAWKDILCTWRARNNFSEDQIRVLTRWKPEHSSAPSDRVERRFPNPKAACLYDMAPHARGEFWLWSDADVIAPEDLIEEALGVLETNPRDNGKVNGSELQARAITIPYRVCQTGSAPGVLDMLYVNAELLPGLRLISATSGTAAFALGAFTLFRAHDFHERADWQRIGESLADDFELGQALQPVAISGKHLVEIAAEEPDWTSALLHYYRWQKNIRWCQPVGFAAQIFITPVAVCLLCLMAAPASAASILSLCWKLILLESAWALLLSRCTGCTLGWKAAFVPLWSVIRAATWLAVWLPFPVRWGKTWWTGPRRVK